MTKQYALPRGTSDILPSEVAEWQTIETTARRIFALYAYEEIRTPVFEETGLFLRSLGEATDIVQKQILHLEKEGLSLRPEGTAPIVRSYVENNIDKKQALAKLYYIGPMFRGERPQKGRLRQFSQIGIEAIGPQSRSPHLDAEVITLSVVLLKHFGISDFCLKINTLGTLEEKKAAYPLIMKKLQPLKTSLCDECKDRLGRNPFRVLDCKNKKCQGVIEGVDFGFQWLSEESRAYFSEVKNILGDRNISFTESPNLVRGLDYYTGIVFELSCAALGSQDAVGAGGRYDSLVKDLGGPSVDAVGCALGIERMLLAIPDERKPTTPALDAYILALDGRALRKAGEITEQLRANDIAADMCYRTSSVKSLMRAADKSAARYAIIIGEDELAHGAAMVKDMVSGQQQKIPFNAIASAIRKNRS